MFHFESDAYKRKWSLFWGGPAQVFDRGLLPFDPVGEYKYAEQRDGRYGSRRV